MAFTNAAALQIRVLLGYQNSFRYKNTRLESALTAGQVDSDGEVFVLNELAAVKEIDVELRAGGVGYISAGAASVDRSLKLSVSRGERPMDALRNLGRMHIGRLATFFGVEILSDYFGTAGYGGDPWSDGIGTKRGGGTFDVKLG